MSLSWIHGFQEDEIGVPVSRRDQLSTILEGLSDANNKILDKHNRLKTTERESRRSDRAGTQNFNQKLKPFE